MATLRGLKKKLTIRGTSRYLQSLGITQPSGKPISDRWIGDQLRGGASHHKNPATAKKNVAYIDARIKNVDMRKVHPVREGEHGITSGAEPQVALQTGSKIGRGPLGGDRWVGTEDTRQKAASRDLTKQALTKLIAGSGLSPSSTWKMAAFGEFFHLSSIGKYHMLGTSGWARGWNRVNVQHGSLFFDAWQETELEIQQEITAQSQAAQDTLRIQSRNPLALLDPHSRESIKRKIARGDPKDPEQYPSFAARYCTIASGRSVVWRNVYAASVNYPVGGV